MADDNESMHPMMMHIPNDRSKNSCYFDKPARTIILINAFLTNQRDVRYRLTPKCTIELLRILTSPLTTSREKRLARHVEFCTRFRVDEKSIILHTFFYYASFFIPSSGFVSLSLSHRSSYTINKAPNKIPMCFHLAAPHTLRSTFGPINP